MGKTAFLFSGQGSQYPGMMKEFYESCAGSRAVFEAADRVLGRSISNLCFSGAQEDLDLTENTQPCVLACDVAALRALEEKGVKADVVAGFSLGEYAALVAAGVLPFEEAIRLIQIRANAMQAAVPVGKGGMVAVLGKTAEEVDALCEEVSGFVKGANYNCPGQVVVSGDTGALDELKAIGAERRIKMVPLSTSAPFHSERMEPAARVLEEEFKALTFAPPAIPVVMNVDAEIESDPASMKEKLVRQAMAPVLWEKTLRKMMEMGVDTFIEIGPGKTLSGFVKKACKGMRSCRVENLATLGETVSTLSE